MMAVPADMPETTPVPVTTVAIEVELLVHVPPVVILYKVVVLPVQTLAAPVFGDRVSIVTPVLVAQPGPNE